MAKWEKLKYRIAEKMGEIPNGVFKIIDEDGSKYKIAVFKGRRDAYEDVLAEMEILEREPEP